MDKLSPTNLFPLEKWSQEYSVCLGGKTVGIWKYRDQIGWGPFVQGDQIFGDHLSRGTKFDGDRLSRGTKLVGDHLSMGTEILRTICPWGPNWLGDCLSRGTINWGPNVSFSSSQRNLIKTFQIGGMIALITKMTLIFSSDLLNGQK